MTPKHKRRLTRSSKKHFRPNALAKLGCNKASSAETCTDLGKKRIAVLDSKKMESDVVQQNKDISQTPLILSPIDLCKQNNLLRTPEMPRVEDFEIQLRIESLPMLSPIDLCKQNNLLRTPKTPLAEDSETESRLESLPMDLMVKILCHLHHDQLRAVFHVSIRIRKAASLARKFHFNYTTPDRSRQEMLMTMTPRPTEHWPFVDKGNGKGISISTPHTPKAPKHGPRPPSRIKPPEMRHIAAVLFQESTFPPRCMVPSVLSRSLCKSLASNRVLFYEDVTQNKLL